MLGGAPTALMMGPVSQLSNMLVQALNVTEAIPKCFKRVVGNDRCLRKFDDIDAINEIFYESSVIRKC